MSQIAFDSRIAEQLEAMYRRRDVLRRRQLVRDALDLSEHPPHRSTHRHQLQ